MLMVGEVVKVVLPLGVRLHDRAETDYKFIVNKITYWWC